MAYMHRGSEKREPKSVVVIPHSAPIDTTYFAQLRPILENASGKAALALMVQKGTINVKAALTRIYPSVTTDMDTIVATGIDTAGLRASSPEVAETHESFVRVLRLSQWFAESRFY